MSKPLRYALLGTAAAVILGLAAWCLLTGYRGDSGRPLHTNWVAVATAISVALLASQTGGRCGKWCKRGKQPQEQQ
jgi:hypothetical protein